MFRIEVWTESIALGAKGFVKTTQEKLGIKGKGQEILGGNGSYQLREAQTANNGFFDLGNSHLRSQNTNFYENIS